MNNLLSGYVPNKRSSLANPVSMNGKLGIINTSCIEITKISFLNEI